MSRELVFGKPATVEQALLRLPDGRHPEYGKDEGGPIEHLVHFQEHLVEMLSEVQEQGLEYLLNSGIDIRNIPLELEDIKLLERYSFRRDMDNSVTIQVEYIPEDNVWSLYLPSGDDEYRWWQISKLIPPLGIPSVELLCIEMNSKYIPEETSFRFDDDSEFEVFLLTTEELNSLYQLLKRNERE